MKETQSLIITIGRQFGSGGRGVAKILSEKYGIPLYDKELINRVSRETGICNEVFSTCDECTNNYPNSSLLGGWSLSTLFSTTNRDMLSGDSLFAMQSETIRRIASEGPCVIVGRRADQILKDRENLFRVFITAPLNARVQHVMEREGLSEQESREKILRVDKERARYYDAFALAKWGGADNYDLCVDTTKVGMQRTVDMITNLVMNLS